MLYEAMMTDCVLMEKERVLDGKGGWTTEWTEGAQFKAAILKNTTTQALVAEKQGMDEVYTITVSRDVPIVYHDAIKRIEDGKIFQITSEPVDNKSPQFSAINFGQFTARAWELVE